MKGYDLDLTCLQQEEEGWEIGRSVKENL